MARDRLNDCKCVADAMGQLAEEQAQAVLGSAARGDVAGAFEDKAAPIEGLELQAALDDQVLAAFALLQQLAGPASLLQQFCLQRGE